MALLSMWVERQKPQLVYARHKVMKLRPGAPNLSLKSDPACIAFRSLSAFRYLGFVLRLGAGGAA